MGLRLLHTLMEKILIDCAVGHELQLRRWHQVRKLLPCKCLQIANWFRLSSLSLTASLYSGQLLSNLALVETSVQAISTRVLIQNALQRYNANGNNTDANWSRANMDLQTALAGVGTSQYLLQGRVVSKNGTGVAGGAGLVNVTGQAVQGQIALPYSNPNGTQVYLGDDNGYPSNLYPNLTFTSEVLNSTFNQSFAFFDGMPLYANSTLFLGPWQLNESFSLVSITVPIINNTSAIDTLGWLTVIINAELIYAIENSQQGLGDTGVILLVGPATDNNKFPPGVMYNSKPMASKTTIEDTLVRFVLPPGGNVTRSTRHSKYAFGQPNTPFRLSEYPAVQSAVAVSNHALNNAGSILSSTNEEGDSISAGWALPSSGLVDWILLVEQAHSEVVQPINHLRNILIACVFGTTGGLLLILFPIAHYSVRPIRRLREATKRSIDPYSFQSDEGSIRTSVAEDDGSPSGGEDNNEKSAGLLGQLARWRTKHRKSSVETQEQERRQTFRIPGKVQDRKHFIHDELTDLTKTFNEMSEELAMQYERLEERVRERTAELELSKKAAEAANESKTLFIANISHELKTPLNGILGMCAVSMHEEDQTKIKRSLGIIYKSGDLLLHLLTDLLTFSKNQIGQQLALDEKEFRLTDVSSQILSIFEKQAKEGSITLRVAFEGPNEMDDGSGAPATPGYGPYGTGRVRDMCVWGDQHRILQVIINLVSNSLYV